SPFGDAAASRWDRAEALLERAGERLNPILVKEARQALKSRQFVVTFTLLLLFGWGWSLLGIAFMSPGVYYAPAGPAMLLGYYVVLAIPLLVVVPFAAFRSLASEREDGTYELLSITALSSRHIVTGKLGSSMLQMMVYFSALSPCLVFTYVLRGIDIITIGLVLGWTLLFSVGLSAVGLLFATASRARNWQVLLSVVFLLALLFAGFMWSMGVMQIIGFGGSPAYDDADFWIAMAACLTLYAAAFALVILASAAQITFVSANRSTKLRVVMAVHQLLWIGWTMFFWLRFPDDDAFFVMIAFAAIYWGVVGAVMTGEAPQLSPRARRSLPQSFLGRAFLTWFNPGSGTGYAFAVANMASLAAIVIAVGLYAQLMGVDGKPNDMRWIGFSLMAAAYLALYLGIGRLILLFMRRFVWGGLAMSFVIQIFVAAMGAILPFLVQLTWLGVRLADEYTLLQATNWAWTMYAIADDGLVGVDYNVYWIVGIAAAAVFLANLIFAAREVSAEREITPERVLEDELQLHPERAPKPPGPQSPWDYEAEPATP
ncbi:MAG: ABC transporter permease, partial [Planctomycetes bacterium]|nr:ABC transporter permease [Planctomycetota bacterium]